MESARASDVVAFRELIDLSIIFAEERSILMPLKVLLHFLDRQQIAVRSHLRRIQDIWEASNALTMQLEGKNLKMKRSPASALYAVHIV